MVKKLAIGLAIALSLFCMLLSLAPFMEAVFISLLMLLLAGFIGYKGWLQSALLLLLINTLSVVGCPVVDLSNTDALIAIPLIFIASFTGVLIGVRRLLRQSQKPMPE